MGCADHATTRPERRYSGVPLGALGGLSHAPLRAVLSPPLGRTSAAHLTSARGSFERTRVHAPRPAPRNGGHSALYALRCREAVAAAKILDPLIQHTWRGLTDHFVTPLGLPMDRVTIDKSGAIVERSVATSPTNIGLYLAALLVQRDRGAVPGPEARARVVTTLATLERLPKDSRGFLFNWYDASDGALRLQSGEGLDASGVQRTANDGAFVSSVDNGNLMIALEGLRHGFRDDPAVTRTIDAVLTPMKLAFSEAFLETETGSLAAGTLRLGYYVGADQRELRTPHHYDRFGSEARSTVALLEAEGYLPEGSLALLGERTSVAEAVVGGERVRVFKAWDGGVFQWLLPNVLLGETELSGAMAQNHRGLVRLLVAGGKDGLPLAASASDLPDGRYEGKSGVPALSEDAEYVKGGTLTPHALFLLSSIDPEIAARALSRLRAKYPDLFHEGLGFADSVDLDTGAVAHTVLALDQLMSVVAGGGFGAHVQARVASLAALPGGSGRSLKDVYASVGPF